MRSRTRHLFLTLTLSAVCCGYLPGQAATQAEPIRIKVVVVTMFERGEDTGDTPGEFQSISTRSFRCLPVITTCV